jgi:hypothetical protein
VVFPLAALPGHLVREVAASGRHDDLAAVGFAEDGGDHPGPAKRIGQIRQRFSLRAGERRHEQAEQWGEAEHGAGVRLL